MSTLFRTKWAEQIHNAILHNYRAWHVFPLRYDCFRHVQQILKYALQKGPHNWNSRTVEELEEDADCNSSVCKYSLCYILWCCSQTEG